MNLLCNYKTFGEKMSISVAIVGATGNVGREILNILSDRKFPISRIALASRNSWTEVSFGDQLKS